MARPFDTVEEYIAAQPEAARKTLERVRDAIRRALPRAEEMISYNMPTYKIGGNAVLHFAGWKKHFSLYPVKDTVVAAFQNDLASYQLEKGTLRIPFFQDIPVDLIKRIARFRAAEVAEKNPAT
jgi:uncharacterized protein YdhG (YjbR/CyaY superfamily)